jgi:signal recognition particle receptor subunit alpha
VVGADRSADKPLSASASQESPEPSEDAVQDEGVDLSSLTPAQRLELKRAEKRKKEAESGGGSGRKGGKKKKGEGRVKMTAGVARVTDVSSLNYGPDDEEDSAVPTERVESGLSDVELRVEWPDDEDDGATASSASASSSGSWFAGTAFGRALSVFSGGHVITEADLTSVGEELTEHLRGKNVTGVVAAALVEGVKARLVGQTAGAFESMLPVVRDSLRESIRRLLTPRHHIDPLSDARANAERSSSSFRPYVIVFTGINGVGKSTSLAKVVYHLQESGLKPMVAACDTFRSGAVEQLRKHTTLLKVPLYEQGYSKEPAIVAQNAIREAASRGCDVVCVDTAGRMQNNKKLMQELAQLVALNSPDLVLFVGEALVGHDGVDQLKEFHRCLVGFAPEGTTPRGVDGIFLTKCDTIDDKIGAAVSMVHETGIPIVFMGTGQKYPDLKRLSVDFVVRDLMA